LQTFSARALISRVPSLELTLDGFDHVEIDTDGRPPQTARSRHVARLDIQTGGTEIEDALGQTTAHQRREPIVVVNPDVTFIEGETLHLPPIEAAALLNQPARTFIFAPAKIVRSYASRARCVQPYDFRAGLFRDDA
jgi:hypothetical protein